MIISMYDIIDIHEVTTDERAKTGGRITTS